MTAGSAGRCSVDPIEAAPGQEFRLDIQIQALRLGRPGDCEPSRQGLLASLAGVCLPEDQKQQLAAANPARQFPTRER